MTRYLLAVIVLLCAPQLYALSYKIQPGSDIVGAVQSYTIQKNDNFADIARKFDLGILELQEANPKVNPNKLVAGTVMVIPTEFVLPAKPHEGIVLNLAELRVYYYEPNSNKVYTYPVGIGKQGWRTPIGTTKIVEKRPNPVWVPPDSIRAEAAARGHELPDYVPAGPNSPLGLFALNLGWDGYRMHGTNAPSSIGLRSSHGCIRMLPEDIDALYHQVQVGTKVTVIHEPFKVGVRDGQLYLEAHQPFPEQYYNSAGITNQEEVADAVFENPYSSETKVDWSEALKLIKDTYGYPVKITDLKQ